MNRGDIIVLTHAAGGDTFGVDAVTPGEWHVGVISSVTRAGLPREWRDVNGQAHRVRKGDAYRYVAADLSPLYLNAAGVMAQLAVDAPTGTFTRLVDVKKWLRDVRHTPIHRAAVIRAAGF